MSAVEAQLDLSHSTQALYNIQFIQYFDKPLRTLDYKRYHCKLDETLRTNTIMAVKISA